MAKKEDIIFYKKIKICYICKKVKIGKDESICPECLAYASSKNIAYYKINGRKNKESHNAQRRQKYIERVNKGICVSCGKYKPDVGRKRCMFCLEKNRQSQRNIRSKQIV